MEELVIPPEVFDKEDAIEFIRFWIADGRQHISLHIGAMGEHEVRQWGMMLADISIHVIRGLRQDGTQEADATLRAGMEQAYVDRLKDRHVEYTGSLLGTRQ